MARSRNDLIIGALLIALGILVAIGRLGLGWAVVLAAVAAIVLGIFMLTQRRRESPTVAIVLIALGAIVLLSDRFMEGLVQVLNVAVGVLLVVGGILKVESKW